MLVKNEARIKIFFLLFKSRGSVHSFDRLTVYIHAAKYSGGSESFVNILFVLAANFKTKHLREKS